MNDLTKLLDGSIDDVKAGLAGKSHDDLLKLKAAEKGGKDRKGVLDALDAAIGEADKNRAQGVVEVEPRDGHRQFAPAIASDLDNSAPAGIAAADAIDTSGAPQQIVPDVDMTHPAVDADPRENTTETQNRIDFNDPVKPGHEVVEEQLAARGQ